MIENVNIYLTTMNGKKKEGEKIEELQDDEMYYVDFLGMT